MPLIEQIGGHAGQYRALGRSAVLVRWQVDHNLELTLMANLSGDTLGDVPTMGGALSGLRVPCSKKTGWDRGPYAGRCKKTAMSALDQLAERCGIQIDVEAIP